MDLYSCDLKTDLFFYFHFLIWDIPVEVFLKANFELSQFDISLL